MLLYVDELKNVSKHVKDTLYHPEVCFSTSTDLAREHAVVILTKVCKIRPLIFIFKSLIFFLN